MFHRRRHSGATGDADTTTSEPGAQVKRGVGRIARHWRFLRQRFAGRGPRGLAPLIHSFVIKPSTPAVDDAPAAAMARRRQAPAWSTAGVDDRVTGRGLRPMRKRVRGSSGINSGRTRSGQKIASRNGISRGAGRRRLSTVLSSDDPHRLWRTRGLGDLDGYVNVRWCRASPCTRRCNKPCPGLHPILPRIAHRPMTACLQHVLPGVVVAKPVARRWRAWQTRSDGLPRERAS